MAESRTSGPRGDVKYADVASSVAAVAAIVAAAKRNPVSAFPPEVIDLLGQIATDSAASLSFVQQILAAMPGGSGGGSFQGWPPNADYVYTGVFQFAAVAVTQQLPLADVPDDFAIVLKAYPTNPVGSLIYVATSAADAMNPNSSWPLMPNESISYRLKKTDSLYCSASVAPGCAVVWTIELRR